MHAQCTVHARLKFPFSILQNYGSTVDPRLSEPRLSEPRLSEPSIIRIQKQMKSVGSKVNKLSLHHHL